VANKKKRATKVSRGEHGGGGKVRLTGLQKVLLGGGQAVTFRPIGSRPPAPTKTEEAA